jgi:hypothetical protein
MEFVGRAGEPASGQPGSSWENTISLLGETAWEPASGQPGSSWEDTVSLGGTAREPASGQPGSSWEDTVSLGGTAWEPAPGQPGSSWEDTVNLGGQLWWTPEPGSFGGHDSWATYGHNTWWATYSGVAIGSTTTWELQGDYQTTKNLCRIHRERVHQEWTQFGREINDLCSRACAALDTFATQQESRDKHGKEEKGNGQKKKKKGQGHRRRELEKKQKRASSPDRVVGEQVPAHQPFIGPRPPIRVPSVVWVDLSGLKDKAHGTREGEDAYPEMWYRGGILHTVIEDQEAGPLSGFDGSCPGYTAALHGSREGGRHRMRERRHLPPEEGCCGCCCCS